ncbi:hypothetical protein L3X38_036824 [Prunus dulcis]|uniref:Uncharacterized protein n=1 Tax=Prunus dulcis TaxID=3755 RepID=A0AAD4V491_PRUDU|nr:hypothetical protein L3X38_036824 [Prunus dulcis]
MRLHFARTGIMSQRAQKLARSPHGDDDWVGVIIPCKCWNCRASGQHSTEDCPKERVRWVLFPWQEEHEHKSEDCPKKEAA